MIGAVRAELADVLGAWRVVRCRVCGGADCLGAADLFGLCNSQRPGPPLPAEEGGLVVVPPPDPTRQVLLFPPAHRGDAHARHSRDP